VHPVDGLDEVVELEADPEEDRPRAVALEVEPAPSRTGFEAISGISPSLKR
jgi:hypothetical protein